MTHVYTCERHENKNTRFWATYDLTKKYNLTQIIQNSVELTC